MKASTKRNLWIMVCLGAVAWLVILAMLPGCSAPKLAESVEVGVGHSWSQGDWANSQRSFDEQSNAVFVSLHPFAGIDAGPRDPIWGDPTYPRESPDPVPITVTVPPVEPKHEDSTTLIVSSISAVVIAIIGVWQRRQVVAGVKKLVGRKTEEET